MEKKVTLAIVSDGKPVGKIVLDESVVEGMAIAVVDGAHIALFPVINDRAVVEFDMMIQMSPASP
jgi:hypothetical protein